MKVLFLLMHLNKAGMQRAVSNISQALPHEIEQYLGFFGTDNPPYDYCAEMNDFAVPGASSTGFFKKLKNFLTRTKKLRQFVRDNQIDVVVSFGDAANLINCLSFHRAKSISSIRVAMGVFDRHSIYNLIYKLMTRLVYSMSDAVVACSTDLKRQVEQLTNKAAPVYSIPNLYHLESIRKLANEPISGELEKFCKSPFILCVGSIQPRKGQTLLIAAFSLLSKKYPDLNLLLIGEGPDSEKCHQLIAEKGLERRVKIIAFVSNPYKFMQKAEAYVLPSSAEGFPNVLVEAMACGCPALAFDCPTGPREILGESEFGELIEMSSFTALSEKIESLISSPHRLEYLKKQSLKRAANYDSEQVIAMWVEVLKKHV